MKKNFKLLLFVSSILLFSCNNMPNVTSDVNTENKIDGNKVVDQMKNLSSLGTVEYSFSKIIATSDDQWFSLGDRKILMTCKAYLKAGVDFGKITVPFIDTDKKSIEVILPKGEIIMLNIPADDIKIVNQTTGLLRSQFSNTEIQNIQILAEKDIRKKVTAFKITEKAETNAKIFLDKWIRSFGFTSVKISIL